MFLDCTPSVFGVSMFKRCPRCGEDKPRSEFGICRSNLDGLQSKCKQCSCEAMKAFRDANSDRLGKERKANAWKQREYYVANRDHILGQKREYGQQNRTRISEKNWAYAETHRLELREYARQYRKERMTDEARRRKDEQKRKHYAENRERIQQQQRGYAVKNADRLREANRLWRKANPDKILAAKHRYRARKRNLPEQLASADWQAAIAHFSGCCAVCGRPPGLWHTLAADHWISLNNSDCPGTVPWNIVPLCHGYNGCNNSKKDRDAHEWLVARYGRRRGHAVFAGIQTWLDEQRQQEPSLSGLA